MPHTIAAHILGPVTLMFLCLLVFSCSPHFRAQPLMLMQPSCSYHTQRKDHIDIGDNTYTHKSKGHAYIVTTLRETSKQEQKLTKVNRQRLSQRQACKYGSQQQKQKTTTTTTNPPDEKWTWGQNGGRKKNKKKKQGLFTTSSTTTLLFFITSHRIASSHRNPIPR
jgi:hypothetical protein